MVRGRGKLTPQEFELMSVISANINKYLVEQNKKQIDLSRGTGIPPSTLTGYVKGKSLPIPGNVQKIADYFGLKKSDIDPRFKSVMPTTAPNSLIEQISDKVVYLDRELKEPRHSAWISHGERLLEEQKKEEQGTDVEEPMELYSVLTTTSLAAGVGYAFNDYDQETVYVGNRPPRHDLASFISGDSMEPKYHNGDIVYLVDKGFSSYSGEICAVAVNNKTYLKRVYTEKGQLRLVSINPKYDDIYIDFPPTDGHIRIYSVVGTDSVVEN
ncbi:LexA family transcriptional regulator [Streptococcus porci]|uniref:LexA family transcriptional regulator n=1 Tax=Streptococcus porci TaxID=502567 RepID=UPI00040EBBE9|nr:LexA family transcriptional regulator [Streptococcus porci]